MDTKITRFKHPRVHVSPFPFEYALKHLTGMLKTFCKTAVCLSKGLFFKTVIDLCQHRHSGHVSIKHPCPNQCQPKTPVATAELQWCFVWTYLKTS